MIPVLKNIIEFVFGIGLFVNAALFVPQAIRLFKEKSAHDVSMMTFLGFLLIQLTIVLHAYIVKDMLLLSGYLLSMLTCGTVVVLIFLYRKNNVNTAIAEIEASEVLAQLPGHVYWKNNNFAMLGANDNNWRDFGLSSLNDFVGKSDFDLFDKEEARRLRVVDEEVMATGQQVVVEEHLTLADGSAALYLSIKKPLRASNGEVVGMVGNSVDITSAKKTTENRLAMLEDVIALMPGNVYWMDRDGVYLGCNDNQAKVIGFSSRKEIVGKKNIDIGGFLIPEILDPINDRVMSTGETMMVEEPGRLPDGSDGIFLSSKVPLYNREREIVGMVGVSIDITARKRAEEALAKAQATAESLQLIGSSIAHELRTPLSTITSQVIGIKKTLPTLQHSYEIARDAGLPVKRLNQARVAGVREAAELIEKETHASFHFIEMLLMSSRAEPFNYPQQQLSIADCISEAVERYPFQSGQQAMFEVDVAQNFCFYGSDVLIIHVLFNLIKNALYHLAADNKPDKKIVITTTDGVVPTLTFYDNGCGIAASELPHIFDRFYSQTHHGAGVGLAFCQMVMESIGGSISCQSTLGQFTKFTLTFPEEEADYAEL